MKSVWRWLGKIFGDSDGNQSSKRFIAILAFFLIAIAFVMNLFKNLTVEEFMWDGMITIVIFGLGFVASEQFAKILKKEKEDKDSESGE